jgi:predicted kinase
MTNPLLIVFLGFPGSGKTYFAKHLAEELHAVILNSDALRVSMFGSPETIEHIRNSHPARLYDDVFGAMDYATRQTLRAGHTVIYDAQQTKRKNRRNIEKIAHESGAVPILVWIKTRKKTALLRGQEREASDDSHQYSAEKMEFLINRFDSVTDLPEPDEHTIEINGEQPFELQFASFKQQLETIS